MVHSSVMSRGGVKKQLSRIKEVNFRLSQTKNINPDLKSIHFDIGVLAKCVEKLIQDNDELKEEVRILKDEMNYKAELEVK